VENDFILVDDDQSLDKLCHQLRETSWLAIDTEFERTNTYFPELCLIQVSNGCQVFIIDPLRIKNLEPLHDLLYLTSIVKVFHSARQDLELFFHIKGCVPMPVFDTQLAAPLMGYESSPGYARLVKDILGVELSKSQTRTNWKRRPLTDEQLRYAADDVIYLAQIYQRMRENLGETKFSSVVVDHCSALNDASIYSPDPDRLWTKIKEASRYSGEKLAALQQLSSWREKTAKQENRPRKWILQDRAILDMARYLPASEAELASIKSLNDAVRRKYGETLLEIIERARQSKPLPVPDRGRK